MAEESTGSELKLIQKFINMSVCLNSIFVSKNHQAIKLCVQKSFDDLHLDFETSAFKMQKEGPRLPRTSNLNKGQVAGSTTALCRLDCPFYAAARKASHREKLL